MRAAATRFSEAGPYLQVLARLTGTDDPLDARLVESCWLGRDVGVDGARFGKELLEIIGPRAGHYWSHLTPELPAVASGDHGFHVFGVYPWSGLLGSGLDHPRHVLDSCHIRWGTVTVVGHEVQVESRRLTWDGTVLGLGDPAAERITRSSSSRWGTRGREVLGDRVTQQFRTRHSGSRGCARSATAVRRAVGDREGSHMRPRIV